MKTVTNDTMFTDIVWRFLMLQLFVMGALCWECRHKHLQSHFCQSQFVLKVDIHEEFGLASSKGFRMEIKKVFKGDISELKLIRHQFVNLEMDLGCPVHPMKYGDKYLIFGDTFNNIVYSMCCYGSILWEKVTEFQRKALTKYYEKNCDCVPYPKDYTKQLRCKANYSFMRKSGTGCKWIKTMDFRLCEMGWLNGTDRE